MTGFFTKQRLVLALLAIVTLGAVYAFFAPATARAPVMDVKTAFAKAKAGEILLIDIRDPSEWRQTGLGKYARPISMHRAGFLEKLDRLRRQYAGKPIALICAYASRSSRVAVALPRYGFPNVIDVRPGMEGRRGWINSGLPVVRWSGK